MKGNWFAIDLPVINLCQGDNYYIKQEYAEALKYYNTALDTLIWRRLT
jgi:prefoldin subunit 5